MLVCSRRQTLLHQCLITNNTDYHHPDLCDHQKPIGRPIVKQLTVGCLQTLLVKVNPALRRLQLKSWFCILTQCFCQHFGDPNLINDICLGPSMHPAYC